MEYLIYGGVLLLSFIVSYLTVPWAITFAIKKGITLLNTPGTIDSDYRGELQIILINLGDKDFVINNGDRIAQIIIAPVTQGNFVQVETLSVTERGEKGFGSTGV